MKSRRRFLQAVSVGIGAGIAGCIGGVSTEFATNGENAALQGGGSDQEYVPIYRAVADSVTGVRTYDADGPTASGSGFVYDDSHVLTNQHVVEDGTAFEVRYRGNDWRTPEIVATDILSDLAVLRVPDHPDYATPLALRRNDPTVGEEVILVGNPLGFEDSVSAGLVSGVDRSVDAGGYTIHDTIQTDAAANPGNSGGPLVTMNHKVAGVLSRGPTEALNFAISASLARRVVPALIERGEYRHPFLGIQVVTVDPIVAEANGVVEPRGVLVTDVTTNGPAAGPLRGSSGRQVVRGVSVPTGGDVIVAFGGQPVETERDLFTYLTLQASPGETVRLTVVRSGEEESIDVPVGARPEP
ncbi:S1C family serine protease [Halorussus halophilus]|uniref:S1C family serine protease n=1 Tax=Halorussus halophilus TaxID=2650975 RepID=UPI0013015A03|nr:trypsin-like peptidase domain-containing protein [Halorussus halophilus]